MADIGGFAQEGIGRGAQGVLLELADEQQDPSALRGVVDWLCQWNREGLMA